MTMLTIEPNSLKNCFRILRHGESEANRQGIIVSSPEIGIERYGLTGIGVEQVTQTAINARLDSDTVIVSSDFRRAAETAHIIHRVLSVQTPIQWSIDLRERYFGAWDGLDDSHYQTVWNSDEDPTKPMDNNVESVTAVLQRFLRLIQHLEDRYEQKNILLVAHGDVLQIGSAWFHGIDPRLHRYLPAINTAEIRALSPSHSMSNPDICNPVSTHLLHQTAQY